MDEILCMICSKIKEIAIDDKMHPATEDVAQRTDKIQGSVDDPATDAVAEGQEEHQSMRKLKFEDDDEVASPSKKQRLRKLQSDHKEMVAMQNMDDREEAIELVSDAEDPDAP